MDEKIHTEHNDVESASDMAGKNAAQNGQAATDR
jgi:hypothetical protein